MMLDENELKFGDLLVKKGKEYNPLFMFLSYAASRSNVKLLKIPRDIYIPSAPVWKPDYESFLDSRYVRDHGFYRNISIMDYANPDQIEKHNNKANPYYNLGKWLYNCSLHPIDEWSGSDGAKKDALKFKHACNSFYIQNGSYDAKILARQLLNSNYGLASADNWAQRYLYVTDKIYDTLGIKDYLNKVYGDPMLKFKNGSYIGYDYDLTANSDLVNQIIKREEEKNKMADKKEVYTFTTKDFKGNRYDITLEKDFKNNEYPYHARLYTLNEKTGAPCFASTFGYRYWEQLETQLMYDLAGNGIVINKDCQNEVTRELHRAKNVFRGCSYANFDSPYQGGYTADRSKVKPFEAMPKIEKVIFNPPATIVKWKDGTKTVVKCQDNDEFDWEKGLAMAYVKRAFNNERTYYGLFKKNEPWLNLPNSSPLDPVHVHNSNVKCDPKVAKEVRIIVPKELPVTGDIINKTFDFIMKECDKKIENGIELEH